LIDLLRQVLARQLANSRFERAPLGLFFYLRALMMRAGKKQELSTSLASLTERRVFILLFSGAVVPALSGTMSAPI
jgi:hypothetical protein